MNITSPSSSHHQNASQQASQALAPNSPPRWQILQPINNASDIPPSIFDAATDAKENTLPKAAAPAKRKPKKSKGPGSKLGQTTARTEHLMMRSAHSPKCRRKWQNSTQPALLSRKLSKRSLRREQMGYLRLTSFLQPNGWQQRRTGKTGGSSRIPIGLWSVQYNHTTYVYIHMYIQISQEVLDGCATPTQVCNYVLNQAWNKYKACKEWEEHTGEGDGDVDHKVGENDDEEALDEKKPRPKWKKGALPGNYLLKVLQAFKESKVYELHDAQYVVWCITECLAKLPYLQGLGRWHCHPDFWL